MPSTPNSVMIACAGAGKTRKLIERALATKLHQVAILTFTNNNANEIRERFLARCGCVPSNVDIVTWHSFLLRECARPYQNVLRDKRIESMFPVPGRSAIGVPKSKPDKYFFCNDADIYSDKIAEFIIECEKRSNGCVTRRLAQIYGEIYIDEMQDIAGWDLDWCERLLQTKITLLFVGDARQRTYVTNNSAKNRKVKGDGLVERIRRWESDGFCKVEEVRNNYRCNQSICDAANALWPTMPGMRSLSCDTTAHDGVFVVNRCDLDAYIGTHHPWILRYDKNADTGGHHALNFGAAKGMQCDRVIIIPTGKVSKYLATGDPTCVGSIEKLYVAMTRARHSVAFVYDGQLALPFTIWNPSQHRGGHAQSIGHIDQQLAHQGVPPRSESAIVDEPMPVPA